MARYSDHEQAKEFKKIPERYSGICDEETGVTPGMACGSRPVERTPELGAFPTVGLRPAAGLLRTAASVLNPPPPTAGWQNSPADGAERTNQNSDFNQQRAAVMPPQHPSWVISLPWQQAAKNEKQQPAGDDGQWDGGKHLAWADIALPERLDP